MRTLQQKLLLSSANSSLIFITKNLDQNSQVLVFFIIFKRLALV